MNIDIGIDPDSKKNGIAIYIDGDLDVVQSMSLMEFQDVLLEILRFEDVVVEAHIENVCGNNSTFSKPGLANQRAAMNVARSVGKCQQAQIEIERMITHNGVKVTSHPISKNWKDAAGKKFFEAATGWTKQSNEDTRSAAHFGMLGIKSRKLRNKNES